MKRITPQPKGFDIGNGRTRIAVAMPHKLFKQICDLAAKDGKTFSEMTELLLKTGLCDIQESDRLEPKVA